MHSQTWQETYLQDTNPINIGLYVFKLDGRPDGKSDRPLVLAR